MRNNNNLYKVYNIHLISSLLNSKMYIFFLQFNLGKKIKMNVSRWFNEINTLTVAERINLIVSNKYEEDLFRIWFSLSNLLVFTKSMFYEKISYLKIREEKNQLLKTKIVFGISFEENKVLYEFYFSKLFFKHLLTRFVFWIFKLFLYAFFLFAIIFSIWTKILILIMMVLILCKLLYKFDVRVNFEKTIFITMLSLIIVSLITRSNILFKLKLKPKL